MQNNKLRFLNNAAVGCIALFLIACSSAEERAQNYYKSGSEYLEKNDPVKASVEFRNALKIKEDFPDAWFGMAQIEEQAQNWPKVFGDLNKVLELQPKHLKALTELSRLSLLRGDLPVALANVNSAFAIEPDNPDIVALKAAILLKLNDKAGATELADKALKLKPRHADGSVVKATLQQAAGDTAGALSTIGSAISESPANLALYVLELSFYERSKDVGGQERTIRAIVAAFPEQAKFKQGLIDFLVRQGRNDEAEAQLRKDIAAKPEETAAGLALVKLVRDKKGDAAARLELEDLANSSKSPLNYWIEIANFDYAAGKTDIAFANLQKLAEQAGITDEGIALRLNLAGKFLDSKKNTEASAVINEILANDAQNVGAQKLKAALLIAENKPDEAVSVLRESLNYSSNDASIRLLLASAYEQKLTFDLASKEYTDAYSLSNGRPNFGLELAKFQLRRGDAESAEQGLANIASRYPQYRPALVLLADLRLKKQDWKGAEDIAKMIKEAGGANGISEQILGESLLGQKRFDEAISLFQVSTTKAPDALQPMFALVRTYLSAGKVSEAEAFVKSALQANPTNANAHVLLGTIELVQGKQDAAKASFETAIAKDGKSSAGYLALAQFYFGNKQVQKAVDAAQAGIGKVEDETELRMVMAGLLETDGKLDGAVDQYEKLIAKNVDSMVVVNNYVSIVSDNRDDEVSLKRAAELGSILRDSPIPEFQETFGWILVRTGNVKEGLRILEKVNDQLSQSSGAQFHIGLAYAKSNDPVRAKEHLQIALQLEKNEKAKAKIQKSLAELPLAP
jgi:cellulose synthase operon protein C